MVLITAYPITMRRLRIKRGVLLLCSIVCVYTSKQSTKWINKLVSYNWPLFSIVTAKKLHVSWECLFSFSGLKVGLSKDNHRCNGRAQVNFAQSCNDQRKICIYFKIGGFRRHEQVLCVGKWKEGSVVIGQGKRTFSSRVLVYSYYILEKLGERRVKE